jgi:GTP-binding protein
MSGLIAIVGRPNVGKSALFNRIVGRRIAIVHDEPGVTRDRITAEAEFRGRPFTLVDTGGIGLLRKEKAADVITRAAVEQVDIAIETAQVIIFVVNVQEGLQPLDREVAERLRKSGKPVLVAVNKSDNSQEELGAGEFASLGFSELFAVSAIHGRGMEALLLTAMKFLPETGDRRSEIAGSNSELRTPNSELKLAIIGRPNVGKSSIINALTGSKRVIVSEIPGTTRDSVDVPFEVETEGARQRYVLIDTAGVRKEKRIDNSIEFYSVARTDESIARADLVVFVLDAESGIMEQDKKIGAKITEKKKPCILVVNKWDLFAEQVAEQAKKVQALREKDRYGSPRTRTSLAQFAEWVQENLFFLDYAPVIFTSAKSGFQLDRLLEAVRYVAAQLKQQVPTSILNRTLRDAISERQPVSASGNFLNFFYATQVKQVPPTFVLFVNRAELFSPAYEKFLAQRLRRAFGYEGCPIVLLPRARPKTIESVRRDKPRPAERGRRKPKDRFKSKPKPGRR